MIFHCKNQAPNQQVDDSIELFFDLVFVFAISQLSHHLTTHMSWHGLLETTILLLAVLTVWSYTSWAATMASIGRAGTRRMLLIVMLAGLFMNAAIPKAFAVTAWAWVFVSCLLSIQLGRTLWTIFKSPVPIFREHYIRVFIWFVLTSPLWIAGAAWQETRLGWWVAATGLELLGTWLAHPVPWRRLRFQSVEFDAEHMLERCRLFVIIALGETVLTAGTAISEAPLTFMTFLTGVLALVVVVALWSLSFGRSGQLAQQHAGATDDPVHASRYGVNALIFIVTGLVAAAVGNRLAIMNPVAQGVWSLSALLIGGPLLVLVSHAWYLWCVPKVYSRVHLYGSLLLTLILAGCLVFELPAYLVLALVGICLSGLAVTDLRLR